MVRVQLMLGGRQLLSTAQKWQLRPGHKSQRSKREERIHRGAWLLDSCSWSSARWLTGTRSRTHVGPWSLVQNQSRTSSFTLLLPCHKNLVLMVNMCRTQRQWAPLKWTEQLKSDLMEFRFGITFLRQWFLSFHEVFLFHNSGSSRKLHRVKPRSEPDAALRLSLGRPWSQLSPSHRAAVLLYFLISLGKCATLPGRA